MCHKRYNIDLTPFIKIKYSITIHLKWWIIKHSFFRDGIQWRSQWSRWWAVIGWWRVWFPRVRWWPTCSRSPRTVALPWQSSRVVRVKVVRRIKLWSKIFWHLWRKELSTWEEMVSNCIELIFLNFKKLMHCIYHICLKVIML